MLQPHMVCCWQWAPLVATVNRYWLSPLNCMTHFTFTIILYLQLVTSGGCCLAYVIQALYFFQWKHTFNLKRCWLEIAVLWCMLPWMWVWNSLFSRSQWMDEEGSRMSLTSITKEHSEKSQSLQSLPHMSTCYHMTKVPWSGKVITTEHTDEKLEML